jgi:putative component of toxin-antitoxin plasmid stabilization module
VWVIEVEPEVATWLDSLAPSEFDQAAEAIDRLHLVGNRVRMPLSRPLGDGLFELRFQCEGVARRITFWYADWQPGLIVLLTTFHKQRSNERREVDRARSALQRCHDTHLSRGVTYD